MKKLLIILLAGFSLAACSSNKAPISAPVASMPVEAQNIDNTPAPVTVTNAAYFDFNKYNVKSEYSDIVTYNANYLSKNSNSLMKIEGNTDDIGSVEYNLSLGQKRADALKKALVGSGVSANQLDAVSNGKLKPKFDNSTSEGQSYNRRADMFYSNSAPSQYSVTDGTPSFTFLQKSQSDTTP